MFRLDQNDDRGQWKEDLLSARAFVVSLFAPDDPRPESDRLDFTPGLKSPQGDKGFQ
jgi:hypothetical protein